MSNAKTAAVFAAGATVGLIAGSYGTASLILRSKQMQKAYGEHLSDQILKWMYGEEPEYKSRNPRRYNDVYKNRRPVFMPFVLETQEDASKLRQALLDLNIKYGPVLLADLNDLLNRKSVFGDDKWGWKELHTTAVVKVDNGWSLDIPEPEYLK